MDIGLVGACHDKQQYRGFSVKKQKQYKTGRIYSTSTGGDMVQFISEGIYANIRFIKNISFKTKPNKTDHILMG